ncbi:methyl-accepting chemotaxis protein [Clostridium sp. YIM B02555]|uniref:methyl-accepting chemotaxis protein n=1 Tax=Clostridium sp. YIM B02555 TaxID=2911968 RepID=UPI001EEDC633|nr:methyl-accepting chemotaxis protein [Clostridium sp. YIM B02555]
MRWYMNLKIKSKIFIAFIGLVILMGLVGLIGILNLQKISTLDNELYENNTKPIGIMSSIQVNLQKNRIITRNIIIENDINKNNEAKNALLENDKVVDKTMEEFKSSILNNAVLEEFNNLRKNIDSYRPVRDKIIELRLQNKTDEAISLMNGEGSNLVNSVDASATKLIELKETQGKEKADNNSKSSSTATITMLGIIILGIIIALVLGIIISGLISKPINRVLHILEEMSKGHLGERIKLDTKDEIGQMAKVMDIFSESLQGVVIGTMKKIANGDVSMNLEVRDDKDEIVPALNKIIENVRKLVLDANMLSKAAIEGNFEVRADSSKHEGDFKKIIEGVNETLDTVVDKAVWYEAIIDAIPFPIHVTDKDMNWTYMNKAFEKLMIEQGVVRDRKSGYGLQCCNAGANICNTEKCGIKQLHKGKTESFFEWCGMSNKQDTSYLKNKKGETVGYVEVVTDLTPIIRVSDYTKTEVERIEGNLKLLSSGNTDFDLKIKEPDSYTEEVSKQFKSISDSLEEVKNAVDNLIKDSNVLSKAATEGKLDTRADAEKHSGAFKKIVEGVNKTLDSVIGPLHVAAEYVDRISRGDIPDKITDEYHGDFNEIKNNLNNCIDVMNGLLNETDDLIKATQAGELDTRGNSKKFAGGWGTLVEGINKLIDAFVAPINVTAEYVDRISKGDLPEKITAAYYGDFNLIKNNLNSCIDNIKALVEDANMLSEAATEGNLNIRAEAAKHNGDYRKIVEGVNKLIEAMVNPIQEVTSVMNEISKGNLENSVSESYKGEFGVLAKAVNSTEKGLKRIVGEIDSVIGEISNGNLAIENVTEFHGNFKSISLSLNRIVESLNSVLGEINSAAEQVFTGAGQVADGSQALSKGATEQASSIEELTASITEVAAQTRENSVNANQAKDLALKVKENAEDGNRHMSEMLKSMSEINESSANISKIIKVIDEIAFQTNILALNAAVEAARAGQHGKGFAVVAEEVRNLAARSANAAKETTTLIEGSIRKAETGTEIANNTAKALYEIVDGVTKAASLVSEIAAASEEQASGITQINVGIEQVSRVIQTNSATAEESAAASEELSSQSELLKDMVANFRLKNSSSDNNIMNYKRSNRNKAYNAKNNMYQKESAATLTKVEIDLSDNEFGKY